MQDDEFEWDDGKAASNIARHGVSFEAAREAFDDAFGVMRHDFREKYGEERYTLVRPAGNPHPFAAGADRISRG